MAYDFLRIEKKWQNYWLENKTYRPLPGIKRGRNSILS